MNFTFSPAAVVAAALLLAGPAVAQTSSLPQLAAEKLCACVGETSQPDSAAARLERCMPKSLADAAAQQGSLAQMGTVEGIQEALVKTRQLAAQSSPTVRFGYAVQRTRQFYTRSANAAAQQAYDQGTELLRKKQYREALPLFQQAVRQDARFVQALDHTAICYRQLQELKKAAATYEKSLAVFPEGDVALLNMAVVQQLLERPAAAQQYFEQLRFFHPYNPEGYFGAGKLALLRRDFPAAMDNIFQAHRLYVEQDSPYLPDSNKLIGLLYGVMKEKNQLDLFRSTAQRYNLTIQE